jgi:hypothetical protein
MLEYIQRATETHNKQKSHKQNTLFHYTKYKHLRQLHENNHKTLIKTTQMQTVQQFTTHNFLDASARCPHQIVCQFS